MKRQPHIDSTAPGPVLIIYKNSSGRLAMQAEIEALGGTAVGVSEPLEAFEQTPTADYSAIVVAVEPDQLSHLGALARLRESQRGRNAALVVVTKASAAELARLETMLAVLRPAVFLPQPLDKKAFRRTLAPFAVKSKEAGAPLAPASPAAVTMEEVFKANHAMFGQNYWERLGVAHGADLTAIRKAYLTLVNRYRPEAVPTMSDDDVLAAGALIDGLTFAYETLSDPARAARYEEMVANKPTEPRVPQLHRSTIASKPPEPVPVAAAEPPDPGTPYRWEDRPIDHREDWEMLMEAATFQAVQRDYAGALSLAERAFEERPDDTDIAYKIELYKAWRAKGAGKYAAARRHFERAAKVSPKNAKAAFAELEAMAAEVNPRKGRGLFGWLEKK